MTHSLAWGLICCWSGKYNHYPKPCLRQMEWKILLTELIKQHLPPVLDPYYIYIIDVQDLQGKA